MENAYTIINVQLKKKMIKYCVIWLQHVKNELEETGKFYFKLLSYCV